ncbi:MAG: hypothetical protein KDI44_06460 [Thiothrix sp.]|nr:hypothetical protein [Thiothrix sp.]HPQ95883.1 hypothetical protein [Thiolinea sp.]
MDKQALRTTLLALAESEMRTLEQNYREHLEQAKIDDSDSHDEDELSHAAENGELAVLLEQPMQEQQEKIRLLQDIDFSPKTRIEAGAVVRFNNQYLVIAIATSRFDYQGDSFMGISTAAPIYTEIQGLEAGDTFEFNDRETEIQAVY